MNFYELSAREAVKALGGNMEEGLTDSEAARRLSKYGPNRLADKKKKGFMPRFAAQFNDFMIIILLLAAAVSYVSSFLAGEPDAAEPLIILAIVVFNAVLGTAQQMRAQSSLEALKKLSSPRSTVIRGGREENVPSEELVPGDIVRLKAGDMVCADCRILSCVGLLADESSLTGEADAAAKDAAVTYPPLTPIGDMKNMLFSSSYIMSGTATAIAVKTGMDTEVGKIASVLIGRDTSRTPLEKRLGAVGRTLGTAALLICGVVFLIGTLKEIPPFEMFMTSVSLAVAAIPEGLPAIVTIMLALGVVRMSRHNAVVRSLPSVETLGCTTVICSDKTGTITRNEMTVRDIRSRDTRRMLELAAVCSESGSAANPTDRAVRAAAQCRGSDPAALERRFPIDRKIPFDSQRKMMTVRSGDLTIVKGAFEYILPRCTMISVSGTPRPMTERDIRKIKSDNAEMTSAALRVIACACGKSGETDASNMVFLGLIGIADPPRAEARDAVLTCRRAGIRPIMITGDHADTALSIAKQVGIADGDGFAVTGAELDAADDEALRKTVGSCSVYARVSPSHKARIVEALKKNGEVVAMTGDGVNDAPALHIADIGCSMGISGTDVAKSASDMILTDDNFATIVYSVCEGRAIFDNIRKAVKFLLSSNIGEILTVLLGIILGRDAPLTAAELLWVNLVTDSLPAVALGLDPPAPDIMRRRPVDPKLGIFSGGLWGSIIWEGLMIGALSLAAHGAGLALTGDETTAGTMGFFVLSVSQLVHAFNMRSDGSVVKSGLFANKFLLLSLALGVAAQLAVIFIPAAARLFDVSPLPPLCLCISCAMSLLPLPIVELQKALNALRM